MNQAMHERGRQCNASFLIPLGASSRVQQVSFPQCHQTDCRFQWHKCNFITLFLLGVRMWRQRLIRKTVVLYSSPFTNQAQLEALLRSAPDLSCLPSSYSMTTFVACLLSSAFRGGGLCSDSINCTV